MYYKTAIETPLGGAVLAGDEKSLVGLWFSGQKYFFDSVNGEVVQNDALPVFTETKKWLDRYFNGEKPAAPELPLAPNGSAFRIGVWDILCKIPYGKYTTYGEIAKKMAANMGVPTMSSQAIGGAVGHNPISIIIPCHRVIGANKSLTGYAGGTDKKAALLTHEGVILGGLTQ